MYTPRLFREDDVERIDELIEAHPFGLIVVAGGGGADDPADPTEPTGGPVLTHVPCLLDRGAGARGTLRFHVARANPVARSIAAARETTVVFQGPHGYVSASWYERPHEQVPTWNYAVVHAHGRARELSREETVTLLRDLAAAFEDGGPAAWNVDRLAPEDLDGMLPEIVGFALPIERIEGKFKLSQNRSPEDRRRVVEALRRRGTPDDLAMVRWME